MQGSDQAYLSHDVDLVLEGLHVALLQVALLDALHGVALVGLLVLSGVDHGVGSRSQSLLEFLRHHSRPSIRSDC